MTFGLLQPSLSGGELTPSLASRVDVARYFNSLALARNWMVTLSRGLQNRPGTQFIEHALDDAKRSRLVPFVFSADQAYALEFGDQQLKILRDGKVLNSSITETGAGFAEGTTNGGTAYHPSPAALEVDAFYLTDWQGTAVRYFDTPRTNWCLQSESFTGWTLTTGSTLATGGAGSGPRPGSVKHTLSYSGSGTAGAVRFYSPSGMLLFSTHGQNSIWMKASGSITLELHGTDGTVTSCAVTTSWQRFSVQNAFPGLPGIVAIASPSGDNTAFSVDIFGGMMEDSETLTPYIGPTTSTPVTQTDWTFDAAANEVDLGFNPGSGHAITWDGIGDSGSPIILATPYHTADLPLLSWTQSADVLTLAHPSYPQQEVKRFAETSWTISAQRFDLGPFQDPNPDQTLTVNVDATDGPVNLSASGAVFSDVVIGQLFRLAEAQTQFPWKEGETVSAGAIRRWAGSNYMALNGGTAGSQPPIVQTGTWNDGGVTWRFLDSGWGAARITSVAGDGRSATGIVTSHIPDSCVAAPSTTKTVLDATASAPLGLATIEVTSHGYVVGQRVTLNLQVKDSFGVVFPVQGTFQVWDVPNANHFTVTYHGSAWDTFISGTVNAGNTVTFANPTYIWSKGSWSSALGYPGCVCYHQQRLVYAGSPSFPQTFWMSRSDAFGDFSVSTPVQDDDSLSEEFAANQENRIVGLLPLGQLMALTTTNVWIVGSYTQAPLTPANLSARIQAYNGGAAGVPIVGVDSSALFLQAKGETVRGFGYSYQYAYDNYSAANNFSIHAQHLFDGHTIQEWAFQQVPASAVWAVRDDGVLLQFTYNQEQQVAAWTHHETDGAFESVCCIPENGLDVVYAIVRRTINGSTVRHIERFANRLETDPMAFWFLDDALAFDGRNTSSKTITLTGGTTWDQYDQVTLTASSNEFGGANPIQVGDQVVFVDADDVQYRIKINHVTSFTVATGIPDKEIPAPYRSTPRTDWAWAAQGLVGLDHLEGQTLSVLGDGNEMLNVGPVSSGAVALPRPCFRAVAGIPYTSDGETLPVVIPQDYQPEKKKSINCLRAQVLQCAPLWAGQKGNEQFLFKVPGWQLGSSKSPTAILVDGFQEIRVQSSWQRPAAATFSNRSCLPATILSLVPEVMLGGN